MEEVSCHRKCLFDVSYGYFFGDLTMSDKLTVPDYESYMRRALELAKKAEGDTSPNPMV